jgi:hypothetical protein
VLLCFGKALRSSFVLPVTSEAEESDEEKVSAFSLFYPCFDFKMLLDSG